MKIKPLGDHVLVEPAEEKEVKKGGIIIPDTAKEKPTEGIVRAVGPGKKEDDGKTIPIEVKEGDRVSGRPRAGAGRLRKERPALESHVL